MRGLIVARLRARAPGFHSVPARLAHGPQRGRGNGEVAAENGDGQRAVLRDARDDARLEALVRVHPERERDAALPVVVRPDAAETRAAVALVGILHGVGRRAYDL